MRISDSEDHRKFISSVVCLERISKAMTTLWFSWEPFIGDLLFFVCVFSSDQAFADSFKEKNMSSLNLGHLPMPMRSSIDAVRKSLP